MPLHRLQENYRSRAAGRPFHAQRNNSRRSAQQNQQEDAGGLSPQTYGDDQSLRRSAIQRRYKDAAGCIGTGGSIQHAAPCLIQIRRYLGRRLKMPGVVGVMTAEDIKGTNRIRFSVPDQPYLCEDRVRVIGDPIIAIAAKTRDQARAAAAAVKVAYEPLPVILSPEEAMAPGAYQIHTHATNNMLASQPMIKGDAEKALKEAKAVVEAEFTTQINHQAPLEPEISSAYFEGEGENPQLVVVGRSIQYSHSSGPD